MPNVTEDYGRLSHLIAFLGIFHITMVTPNKEVFSTTLNFEAQIFVYLK